jgi:hypothetical protein
MLENTGKITWQGFAKEFISFNVLFKKKFDNIKTISLKIRGLKS